MIERSNRTAEAVVLPENAHPSATGLAAVPLAIIANATAPYRIFLHTRIAREMPNVELHSLFTHETPGQSAWTTEVPADIGPVMIGEGEAPTSGPPDPLEAWREWRKGGRVIDYLRKNNIRAVVCNGYDDPGRLRIIRWCHESGIPLFLWGDSNVRGDRATGLKRRVKTALLHYIFPRCSGMLACGRLGVEYFERYGVARERIFLQPLESDYDVFQHEDADRVRAVAQKLNLPPGRRRLVFCGRLASVKRADMVLDAFSRIADRRPDWDLVMLGDGPLRDRLRPRVLPAITGRVTWAGFLSDPTDVAAVFHASDALVLPSDYEPWALVIVEAVIAGLAIVSSDVVGAAPELVRDGVNGYFFASGDVVDLERKLLEVTDGSRIDGLRAASADVLADWRRRANPIVGLAKALRSVGLDVRFVPQN